VAWLEDSCQRDQFAIRHGNETGVYWCDGKSDPVVDYDGEREKKAGINWCDCKLYVHVLEYDYFVVVVV
jgi:translation initiation factor 3 subunit B